MWNRKRLLVFLLDVLLIAFAHALAYLLRFDFNIPYILGSPRFIRTFALVLAIKPLVFLFSNLYRSLWRYASISDVLEIYKAVSVASVLYVFGLLASRQFEQFVRSVFIMDWLILFSLMLTSRLVWRFYRENYILPNKSSGPKTLIVGAGDAGSMLLKEIRKQPAIPYNVLGFVDDDQMKLGSRLHGVPVLGGAEQLNELIERHKVEKVIIAIPSANRKRIRSLIHNCKQAGVKFKTLPGLGELISGDITISHIKDVEIEDLLGREPVKLDEEAIASYLRGKKVLVTGAGGSIGSEICRQIARFQPDKIVLFDSAETPLFFIERELSTAWSDLQVIPIIGDIRDEKRVETVFKEFEPEVVFHAAAYKHVPMMEFNPVEAVTNNIGGTSVLADMAARFGVTDFVMISTDKAVNPTNTMGASKRVAEIYVQALAEKSSTKFTTVRFGNVMGSNGSVIPMFKEQIKKGGPVTVTDPKVVRYFMTIPEATQLVLQAGCLGQGGEIFLLDMGEPVPILELAEELIRLSGLVPYADIDIQFTGLRPGEKLYEELLIAGEGIKPTVHDKIKVLAPVKIDFEWVVAERQKLLAAAQRFDLGEIMTQLQKLVPEYAPVYHFIGNPPPAFRRMRPDIYPHPMGSPGPKPGREVHGTMDEVPVTLEPRLKPAV